MVLVQATIMAFGGGALAASTHSERGCAGLNIVGDCAVANTGSSVTVGASRTTPGGGGGGDVSGPRGNAGDGYGGTIDSGVYYSLPNYSIDVREANASECFRLTDTGCLIVQPPEPGDPDEPDEEEVRIPTADDVTVTDLLIFSPPPASFANEPAGFAVVGLPTNLVASASAFSASGELLDFPVAVSFAPVSFTFDAGDGTTYVSDDGGTSWDSLGQPQFSPTPTAHTYTSPGDYTASVSVAYAAEVNFGEGWQPVDGTLSIPGAGATITVLEAKTALVERTCDENPSGPGC